MEEHKKTFPLFILPPRLLEPNGYVEVDRRAISKFLDIADLRDKLLGWEQINIQ